MALWSKLSCRIIPNKRAACLNYYSISPKVEQHWLPSEHKFRFYSGVSIGMLWRSLEYYDSDDKKERGTLALMAVNLVSIGCGSEDFCAFIDLNFGNRGLFKIGLSYAF